MYLLFFLEPNTKLRIFILDCDCLLFSENQESMARISMATYTYTEILTHSLLFVISIKIVRLYNYSV